MKKHFILICKPLGSLLENFKSESIRLIAKPDDEVIFLGDESRKYTKSEFLEALRQWAVARKEQIDKLSHQEVNLFLLGKNYQDDPEQIVFEEISSWKLGKKALKYKVLPELDDSPIYGYFCISPDIAVRLGLTVSDEPVTRSPPIARFRGDSDPAEVSDFAPPVNLAGMFTMVDDPVEPL